MAMDFVDLGCTPAEEDCEQLGPNYNPDLARLECQAYIGQLKRQHGEPPPGATYKITSNPHDFGTYYEVAIRFSDQDAEAAEYAYKVEEDTPGQWDDQAMMFIDRQRVGMGLQPKYDARLVSA